MAKQQRKNNPGSTKQRILKEAEKLFAVKGFEGTGIEEIARKAGIRKSVIYYHFKNKEQILRTMLDDFVARGVAFKKSFFERYAANFMEKMDVIMNSDQSVYKTLNTDMYIFGQTVIRKYRLLGIAYLIFLLGFTTTVITFVLLHYII